MRQETIELDVKDRAFKMSVEDLADNGDADGDELVSATSSPHSMTYDRSLSMRYGRSLSQRDQFVPKGYECWMDLEDMMQDPNLSSEANWIRGNLLLSSTQDVMSHA